METYYLALFVCALVPRLAVAQGEPTPVVAEKVTYSPAIPTGLWTFLPRGGASRFWGESNITYYGKKVWVHVYDVRKTQFAKDDTNVSGKQESGLDLLVFAKGHRLKRISSTHFTYGRYGGYDRGGDFESVGVRALWLDPKSRKMPIVQVALQDPNALYGTATQYAICVFSREVDNQAIVELRFGKGDSNASGWNSCNTEFAAMSNGLNGIIYFQGSSHATRRTFYKWEADQFIPFRRTKRGIEQEDKPIEVPFDTPLRDE